MKPLEVWTCQRAENLKKKSSKIPKNNYAAKMVSAARRQIIGGGGGGAPINKSRRRRRSQIVGGGGAARPAHSSSFGVFLHSHGCQLAFSNPAKVRSIHWWRLGPGFGGPKKSASKDFRVKFPNDLFRNKFPFLLPKFLMTFLKSLKC